MANEIAKIPTYDDLVNQKIINPNKEENQFQVLLNSNPPKSFIKVNDNAKNSEYIPIDKTEYLLTALFINWRVEVINYNLIANSIAVHVRLFYKSPITGEELSQDGLGAWPIQTKAGCSPVDFNSITHAAIQMALPSAKSLAIKDASDHIGRIFGKDLNRKDLINYETLNNRFETKLTEQELEPIVESLASIFDLDALGMYWNQLTKDLQKDKGIIKLFETKSSELNAKK